MELLPLVCVSLLTWSGTTFAAENVSTVIRVKEGSDVTLPCSLSQVEDINFKKFEWKKDGRQVFSYDAGIHYNNGLEGQDQQFKGRVDYFRDKLTSGNASITIRNTKVTDSGLYTCEFPDLQPSQIFHILLVVEKPPDQYVSVEEGGEAILPCSFSTNIEKIIFDWKKDRQEVFFYDNGTHYNNGLTGQDGQFKGRVFHFENELKNGNASIKIKNAKMEDNGTYSCIFPDKQKYYVTLYVGGILKDRTGEEGSALKPSMESLQQTRYWARLQCQTRGDPEPELHWQDSAGNNLTADGPQVSQPGGYVTLQITVNKTGDYVCVATQLKIRHQIIGRTHVYIEGEIIKENTGSSSGLLAAAVLGPVAVFVLCIIGLGLLVKTGYITLNRNGRHIKETSPQEEALKPDSMS